MPFRCLIASHLTPHVSRITPHASRVWPSLLIFIVPVALFYVPFLLNPNLESTGTYLENRIGGGSSPPFNNLAHFFYYEALKYNSAYYVVFFNGLLLWVAGWQGRKIAGERFYFYLIALLLIVSGAALWWLGQTQIAAWVLAGGTALFFGRVIFSPQTSLAQRVLWLWLAPPFWVYVFLVSRPGKHHYLFLGALALWVGWAVVQGWQRAVAAWPKLSQPAGRWLGVGLAGVALTVFAGHTVMLFLRSDLEYVLTYPDHKSIFYPTDAAYPYGTRIGFGYPFRLGWQLVGQLRRTGRLEGSWAGNDDGNAPIWYMLGAHSTPCYPHYVLQGEITYKGDDDYKVPFDPANFGYAPRYRIWGNNRLRLTVLEFQPFGAVEPIDLTEPVSFEPPVTSADFAPVMTAQPAPPPGGGLQPALGFGRGVGIKNNAPSEYLERAGQLSGRVALLGYDAAEGYAQPGGIVPVTLHWQAQSRLSLRYKVFVHLIAADGQNWGQADDFPVCGTSHANTWEAGQITLDRHLLKLPPDLPSGSYTLRVGMYEPELNLRLNYFDVAGNEQGNSLNVGTLNVKG
ncbi:MAG: hypothetical protein HC875_02545 [Anaerolineales bacterium]|nr:hypothetical protein [Anaerolineales bacterium]